MAQSPQRYAPEFELSAPGTATWGSGGNTSVVTDANVMATSLPVIVKTSATAGTWYVSAITPTSSSTNPSTGVITVTDGSFTITSSDAESSGVTFSYKLI